MDVTILTSPSPSKLSVTEISLARFLTYILIFFISKVNLVTNLLYKFKEITSLITDTEIKGKGASRVCIMFHIKFVSNKKVENGSSRN